MESRVGSRPIDSPADHNAHVKRIWAFVRLSRPHFLLGGALMYAIGAVSAGVDSVGTYLLGHAMVTMAQLTAHFINEYADVETDRLVTSRTFFSGGSGVLAEEKLAPRVALRAGLVTSAMALALSAAVASVSPLAALVGLLALGVSWGYSMPPMRLLDTGWGEVATSAVVTIAVPVVGALVQGGPIAVDLVWKMAALFPVHVAMMLAFEIPDLATDRAAGKTVLAVRIGPARTQHLIGLLLLIMVVIVATATTSGAFSATAWWAVAATALTISVAAAAMRRDRPQILTAAAVATLVALGAGLLVLG